MSTHNSARTQIRSQNEKLDEIAEEMKKAKEQLEAAQAIVDEVSARIFTR